MSLRDYKSVNVRDLVKFKANSRTHSDEQISKIVRSIKEFGFTNPLLIDENNVIIAGHGRLEAASFLDIDPLPCIVLPGLTNAQKAALVIADNKIALDAGWDIDILLSQFDYLKECDFDITLTGFDENELCDILPDELPDAFCEEDAVPESAESVVKLGDVWLLGDHRLMCGDSTSIDAVEKLMNGVKADMVFTDPPYNIAGNTKGVASNAPTNKQNKKLMHSEWDKNFNPDEFLVTMLPVLSENCSVYICTSHFLFGQIIQFLQNSSFKFVSFCEWVKPNPFPSLMKRHWAWASELICYATKGKHVFNYPKSGNALSTWSFPIGGEGGLHPTQKPIAISEHAISHSSMQGRSVLDLFGGSGSTLIACEKLKRKCFMMEIDPKYCDIIIQRYENYSGKKAVRESQDGSS